MITAGALVGGLGRSTGHRLPALVEVAIPCPPAAAGPRCAAAWCGHLGGCRCRGAGEGADARVAVPAHPEERRTTGPGPEAEPGSDTLETRKLSGTSELASEFGNFSTGKPKLTSGEVPNISGILVYI